MLRGTKLNELKLSLNSNKIVRRKGHLFSEMLKYKYIYLLLLPALVYFVIFCYVPMYGVILAFKDFNYSKGIMGSPWIGLGNFKDLLTDANFRIALRNTLVISISKLVITFPCPIIMAVLLNEISRSKLKRLYQTVFTFPHFVSWIVISGIIVNIFSQNGIFNQIIHLFGGQTTFIMTDKSYFRSIVYISSIWKDVGWDSILYLAALAGINPELYEAAYIDGANRIQRILNITLPGIRSILAILLILNIGSIMNGVSFDQIFNLYSPPVYAVADTIDTYVYRSTFGLGMTFGYGTAVGFFKSFVNLILIWAANSAAKRLGESGLF